MQEKHLFEYAIIRIVPRVERQEFLNVGVILYCTSQRFLQCMFELDEARLQAFSKQADITEFQQRLNAFCEICEGSAQGGIIGKLPLASRFRWLTATRSTVLQTSPVHPGMCMDAGNTLKKLFEEMVSDKPLIKNE